MDSIIHYNSDYYKHKDYTTDLNTRNFENNLDVAIAGTYIEGDHINSSCVYSIIENKQQNLIL